jgi:large subunit ribosomal protein L22
MIRGMSVESAMGLLQGLPKRGGKLLKQVLVSAIANAEHNDRADVDRLIISRVCVDSGPIFKRWMPRAMGRANRIQQRTSHITVTVTEQG